MTERLVVASTPQHYEAFAALVGEYVDWCRTRYRDDVGLIEQVFGHQSLVDELRRLPVSYGPPDGRTLLAIDGVEVRGCGAWRRLSHDACEMKRLFVPARFGGRGTGRRLCEALVADARAAGYAWMRLDTGHAFTEAIAMYRSIGFRDCAPYHAYPAAVMPSMRFMELSLMA